MSNETRLREYLKRAAAELDQVQRRLRMVEDAAREPVAVVGMACRYPGGVTSPEDLWDLVESGRDAVTGLPVDRGWDLAALTGSGEGASAVHHGGFLDAAGDFDADFFGVSPREALAMDPQQRLLMTTAWEALERAGIDPGGLRGRDVGVFAGAMKSDYAAAVRSLPEGVLGFLATGTVGSAASGRIAYFLGLEGPAVTVDTACSSSLVTVHLACHALRTGECSLALAGGATVIAVPTTFLVFSQQQGLAPDGRCKSYADRADGTGWAEGAGMLVLERLSDASRLGHRVLATVRGSAVNQDGASNGFTAPSGPSQQRLIRQALAHAGLTTGEVDVIEGHGTGTRLGDPIEAQAILGTYGRDRPSGQPVLLGSLKSNIGHTQAAAGVGGVIKMVMAMRAGVVPATLHVDEPSTAVDWSAGAVRLVTEAEPWPEMARPRRAAISSFGLTGTNAHVILEGEEPSAEPVEAAPARLVPLVLAARGTDALRAQADGLAGFLTATTADGLADVAHALATTRARLPHRAVLVGLDRVEARRDLVALADGQPTRAAVTGVADVSGRVAFVFPGQGAQWGGMATALLGTSPVFAQAIGECAAALDPLLGWSLLDVLRGAPGIPDPDRVDVVQPALFAMMVSLDRLWRSHGVEPAAVVGHSQGEIAAACVAGVLSLPDAARVVAIRARLLREHLSGRGGMASIALAEPDARSLIERWDGQLALAAVNGTRSVVVSGETTALEELLDACAAGDVRSRRIPVDYASHSAQVGAVRAQLLDELAVISPRPASVPLYSTVTGAPLDTSAMDAEYWYRNLRGTVQLAAATRRMITDGYRAFVEVSPHPVLTGALQETIDEADVVAVATGTLRRDDGGLPRFLTSAGELFVRGVPVDWSAAAPVGQPVDLPTYPFQNRRYWLDSVGPTVSADAAAAGGRGASRRYRERWRPVTTPAGAGTAGPWWVLLPAAADAAPYADALLAGLAEHAQVVRIPFGASDQAALAELARTEPPAAVLSLLGFGAGPADRAPLTGTLDLVRTLADADVEARLWCLTRGAVAVDASERPDPAQAMLWGLGRTVALERPDRWGGLIDLPGELDERAPGRLARLLADAVGEDQFAVRASGVYARRLVTAPRPAPGVPFRPRGAALITGGTGGLGAHVARWLATAGCEHLVLVSRGGPAAPGAGALAAELRELGTEVTVAACDVADRIALADLLGSLDRAGTRIGTVIHAAGVLDDGGLDTLTAERIDRVVRPKADGARALDELTAGLDLDAFVLFSSASGVWGNAGQAAYAAANTFLDALAQERRARGLPATSIAWGPWVGDGLLSEPIAESMRRRGVTPMTPESAVGTLSEILADGETCVTVAEIDWDVFAAEFTAARPTRLFDDLAAASSAAAARPVEARDGVRERLAGLPPAARDRALLDLVRDHAAAVLGHARGDRVEPSRPFRDLGFDSVTAVGLRNRLVAATGAGLPTSAVFDHPTPRDLSRRIAAELFGGQTAARPPASVAAAPGEPIAVIAMSCRFPGGVATPDDYWRLLADGVDALAGFPTDRGWQLGNGTPGYAHVGGFLYDAGRFDADFFGISRREALAMDPQQRLLLEVGWEAIERAGLDPSSLRGSATGVFVGSNGRDYGSELRDVPDEVRGYLVTGWSSSALSGRISYQLGLEGPTLTVDTACSASLVAVHLACQSLHAGESTLALAGGVTVMATPVVYREFARQGGLAGDGRCKAFAAGADGTGWGEGAGLVLLERLSDARRNGHHVLAVIRGSAVNQDGASNGLTAPSGRAQERVIRAALASAGLSAGEVDAVEAHGTGTRLGDPIEAEALLATYGREHSGDRPLWLGSVKSNIGHTQAAAGIAGLQKMILAMRHGLVPRTLHVAEPTPLVDWSGGAVTVAAGAIAWPDARPRRAAVSAFGITGTNAHVVVEQGDTIPEAAVGPAPSGETPAPLPYIISARGRTALADQAHRLRDHLRDRPDADLAAVARSLATTRAALGDRAAIVAADRATLLDGLAAAGAGQAHASLVTGTARTNGALAFLFSGQGSQRAGMGRDLYAAFPAFAAALDEVCAHLDPHLDRPLREVLFAGPGTPEAALLDRTAYTQPALFALQVSLFRLTESWGVRPDFLLGHSIGELAAAHAAGAMSLADAAGLVAARGRLMQALPADGAMVAVEAAEDEVLPLLDGAGTVTIAAVNGPASTVIAGDADAVAAVAAHWRAAGRRTSRLRVSHAFHSPHMDGMLAEFGRVAGAVAYGEPRIAVVSNLTGVPVARFDAGYWVRHAREAVRFADGVRYLDAQGVTAYLELGPAAALAGAAAGCVTAERAVVTSTLRADRAEPAALLAALGALHVHGIAVDWESVLAASRGPAVGRADLPTYAFQREHFWLTPSAQEQFGTAVDQARYLVRWAPVALPTPAPAGRGWLLLAAPGDAWAERYAAALADRGERAVAVPLGADTGRAALACALTAARAGLDRPPGGIAVFADTLPSALTVAQALADAALDTPAWLVTRQSEAVGPDDPAPRPDQAAIRGFGRVAVIEHPGRWAGLVDVPEAADGPVAEQLVAVLAGGAPGEDQLAVRASGGYARRVAVAPRGDTAARPVPPTVGTALIIGGTGALGAHVARRLARHGARRIVLAGRAGAPAPRTDALAAELAARGVLVELAACDVAAPGALRALVTRTGGVDTIVHAAGVSTRVPIADLDADGLEAATAAKIRGGAELDALLHGEGGDGVTTLVLFSSIAGVWGSGGQSAYAAGNAYLDALAARWRTAGRRAVSIAWGPWAGEGMAADPAVAAALERAGLGLLPADTAAEALGAALADPLSAAAPVVVADVRWDQFVPVFTATRPSRLFADLPGAAPPPAPPAAPAGPTGDDWLADVPPGERERAALDLVRRTAAAVTAAREPVDADRPFRDLGFDSLAAVELRNQLAAATGQSLPSTVVFDHPSARRLARHLLGAVPAAAASEPATAAGGEDPVVIVAMSCRAPGGVSSPEQLWELLTEGRDAIGGFPADRGWDVAGVYHPDPGHPGTSYTRSGGFLAEAGAFDAAFFRISPREAAAMDPQQRLLLETAWEALEAARLDPTSLHGSATGVFVGLTEQGYGAQSGEEAEGHLLTGGAASVASGRIAYTLGLEGPAVTIDTACSSSLVALHLAAQSLRAGECTTALVGGVSVLPTPTAFVEFSKQRGLAADGRCKSFGEAADGTGWAEGVGVLVLRRLSAARRDGQPVLALLRGSAINSDGASNGLTAPNGPAQERVIRTALANGGLAAAEVDAVEAHGTGTTLGDPIEARALLATYGADRPDGRPLLLGSLKSNLGHSAAASGLLGVVKATLALGHGVLPRTLHADPPTAHVDWSSGAIALATEQTDWPPTARPRRMAVSAFGMSGTNAHVILEEPADPVPEPAPETESRPAAVLLPLSARTPEALRGQAARLLSHLDRHPELADRDVAWSLATTRTTFEHRAAVTGGGDGDRDGLRAGLAALAAGGEAPGVLRGAGGSAHRTVFVFPGQGAQWPRMGARLLASSDVFARCIAECDEALRRHLDRSVRDVLLDPDPAALDRVDVVQPVLWAVMVSLAAVWREAGLTPSAVVGHSQGELAAACVAGALDLETAARVVAVRSRIVADHLAGHGGMLSVAVGPAAAGDLLGQSGIGDVALAAVNGPGSVVLSGGRGSLAAVERECATRGLRARWVAVDYAAHSPQVDAVADLLARELGPVEARDAHTVFCSTVVGGPVEGSTLDTGYWVRNLRETVRFDDATRALIGQGDNAFVEMSPHPVLAAGIAATAAVADRDVLTLGTLHRGEDEPRHLLAALAAAWTNGLPVDLRRIVPAGRAVPLPAYAFDRQRYWLTPAAPRPAAAEPVDAGFWSAVDAGDVDALADTLGVRAEAGRASLGAVLPLLDRWHRGRREQEVADAWRYRLAWTPLPATDAGGPLTEWTVAVPAGHAGTPQVTGIVTGLIERGAEVTVAELADADPAAVTAALKDLATGRQGVLSLLALAEEPHSAYPSLSTGVALNVALIQTLAAFGPRPVWFATAGAVATSAAERVERPAQAAVWGLGRVVALEQPLWTGGLVDLPHDCGPAALDRLAALLAGSGQPDGVALRGDAALVQRLIPAPTDEAAPGPATAGWRPHGTVLVVGEFDGPGAAMARWLAGAGTEHLVLAGPGSEPLAGQLRELGTTVTALPADLDAADLLTCLPDRDRLTGVVHAAPRVVPGAVLAETSLADVDAAVAAATAGIERLADLLRDEPIEAFVLHSSAAGVLGRVGAGAGAAAAARLDALAAARRAAGLPATAVAWGPWAGDPETPGLRAMAAEPAVAALRRALERGDTHVVVADIAWDQLLASFGGAPPMPVLHEVPQVRDFLAGGARPAEEPSGQALELRRRLAALPAAEAERILLALVREQAAASLGHAGSAAVGGHRVFTDLGLDSLSGLDLRNRLRAATGVNLTTTVVFDYPTPLELACHLHDELARDATAAPDGDAAGWRTEVDGVEALLPRLTPEVRAVATERLRSLLRKWSDPSGAPAGPQPSADLDDASDDQMFALIDKELGIA